MSKKLSYWLDDKDVISQVDESWDEHMDTESWTSRASSASIIGKPLINFICDDVTRMYVATMVQSVRLLKKTIVRPYRCDSPTQKRFWQMIVSLEANGLVCVSHELVREEPLPKAVKLITKTANELKMDKNINLNNDNYVVRCSICNHLKDVKSDRWLDVDTFGELNTFSSTAMVIYRVCPVCLKTLKNTKNLT